MISLSTLLSKAQVLCSDETPYELLCQAERYYSGIADPHVNPGDIMMYRSTRMADIPGLRREPAFSQPRYNIDSILVKLWQLGSQVLLSLMFDQRGKYQPQGAHDIQRRKEIIPADLARGYCLWIQDYCTPHGIEPGPFDICLINKFVDLPFDSCYTSQAVSSYISVAWLCFVRY